MREGDQHLPKIERNPIREITNKSKNKLANRLYRNSSLNRINPNTTMLNSSIQEPEPSFLNCSTGQFSNQLVASISLRKLRKKSDTEPYLEMSNGKLLISKSRNYLQESFSKDLSKNEPKKMFRKLEKISHSPENKILPDELIDYPIEEEEILDHKLLKKSSVSSPRDKSPKMGSYYEDKEDLFPEDFMQLLQEDKNIKNEFCYLKKMEHPYDLKIVPFHKNFENKDEDLSSPQEYPKEYITISSRGVTYFSQEQPRFVPLEEWRKEAVYFRKIIKLDFFKNFKVIKNFGNWKKYLRKSAMKSTMEKLKEKLFCNDKYLRSSLLDIRKVCYIMETDVSYCKLDDCQKVSSHKEFKAGQEIFIQNEFERRISELEENMKEILIYNMSESMREFKEENKISSTVEGKGMPLLIGDEKNLEMPYTKEATLRTQQEKFQKFIKLIDLLITHSKVNMMSESTIVLAKKIDEENENYERQVIDSKYENIFKGKQYLECNLTLDPYKPNLFLSPTQDDLISLFEDIVNRSVVRLCRNHKRISSDLDVLSVIYGNQNQFPKETEIEGLKVIMTSDGRQEDMLNLIMNSLEISYGYIQKYVERFNKFAKINFENLEKKKEIDSFEPKDYEMIKNLIEKWSNERDEICKISKEHDGPIFELNLKDFKETAEKTTNDCLTKIKQFIPQIFEESIRKLQNCLTEALSQVEQEPIGVEDLMIFNQNKSKISVDIEEYSDRMLEISCLEILMRNLSPNSESNSYKKYEKETKELQSSLTILRKKIDEADMNNKVYETRAQDLVKEIIPRNKSRLLETYTKIEIACREQKSITEMIVFIQKRKVDLAEIIEEFDNIRIYQTFLNLEESEKSEVDNFMKFFEMFERIWSTAYNFEKECELIEETPWVLIKPTEVQSKLEEFAMIMINLEKDMKNAKEKDLAFQFSAHDKNTTKLVLEKIEKIRPLIEVIEYLKDEALSEKELKEIKMNLESRNEKLVEVLGKNKFETKTKELADASASLELALFKGVASKAKKSHKITKKIESITNFFKKHSGVFRILTERFSSEVDQLLGEVEEKIIMANYVQDESESGEKDRIRIEKQNLEKLREILMLWDQYEKHVQYFEPIHASMDWKNTQEGKNFILATEQNWKKTYKSFKESNLTKILSAERIIPSLRESNELMESLYPSLRTYFNSKKIPINRLCFLSDREIIKIHEEEKDFKGFGNYINKVFPSIKELIPKEEDQYQFDVINNDGEILPMRIGRISNFEVDDMIKAVEEGIKNGVKQGLKNCHASFDSEEFNKIEWIKRNPLQFLIFITGVYFTRIMEEDYLSSEAEDIEKLYNYHLSQIEAMKGMIKEESQDELICKKLTVLLTQAISTRDIIRNLISSSGLSKESYIWLRQVRQYYNVESAYTEYLNTPINYGCEFVNMTSNPLLVLTLNEKAILQMTNTLLLCGNIPITTKSYLAEIASFNAKPYNLVNFAVGCEVNVIESIMLGTWLTGSFTDLTLPKNLSLIQLSFIAKFVQQAQFMTTVKDPYIYGLKNSVMNKESGISIISPQLIQSPLLKEFNVDYRVMNFLKVPWQPYIDLLLEINCLILPNFSRKISKTFDYLEKALPELKIFRKEVRSWFEEIEERESESEIAKLFLDKIKKKDMTTIDKKFVLKIFNEVFGLSNLEQLKSYKTIKDFGGSPQETNKISSILRDRKVCVVTGEGSEFEELIIESVCAQNAMSKSLHIRFENIPKLLGQYENGRWVQGILTEMITSNRSAYILLTGECSNAILGLLEKLDGNENEESSIHLDNGEKLFLTEGQRIVLFSESHVSEDVIKSTKVKIYEIETKFVNEDTFDYLFKEKVDNTSGLSLEEKFFSKSKETLVSIRNMYLNNIDKFNSTNLKTIGYRNEYLEHSYIMYRFKAILNAAFSTDCDKICVENPKMMDKLYLWALFWSIYSSLPKRCTEKLEKLFESIKIESDKSQSICETKFLISESNETISKFIKTTKKFRNTLGDEYIISSELEAKTELIRLLIAQNNHINLIGEKGCGKTGFIDYLDNTLKGEDYATVQTKMTKKMNLKEFLAEVGKIYVQYLPSQSQEKYRLCSITGKKLIVFVDNFNLIDQQSSLFDFFESVLSHGYYYDNEKNCKVVLKNFIFICANSDSFEPLSSKKSFYLRKLFPIYINKVELPEILEAYLPCLDSVENQDVKSVATKIITSSGSLHSFVNNLIVTANDIDRHALSNSIPIWISKEIASKAQNSEFGVHEILNLWKYLSIVKYIHSGAAKEFKEEIEHEIINLAELIVKSSGNPDSHIRKEKQIVQKLYENLPLLNLQFDDEEYYCFLSYLLRSGQIQHLLSHSRKTPSLLKAQAISEICESLQINFIHLTESKELEELKDTQNMVVYVGDATRSLLEDVFGTIIKEKLNPEITFVVDVSNKEEFSQLLRFYSSIQDVANIYEKLPVLEDKTIEIEQYESATLLINYLKLQLTPLECYELHYELSRLQSIFKNYFESEYSTRSSVSAHSSKGFKNLFETIKSSEEQIVLLRGEISHLSEEEDALIQKKNEMVETLSKLKKNEDQTSPQDRESINKQITAVDTDLKKVKSTKNEKIELISKLKESMKEKNEVIVLLDGFYQTATLNSSIFDKISNKKQFNAFTIANAFTFIAKHSLSQIEFDLLFERINEFCKFEIGFKLNEIYGSFLRIDSKNEKIVSLFFTTLTETKVSSKIEELMKGKFKNKDISLEFSEAKKLSLKLYELLSIESGTDYTIELKGMKTETGRLEIEANLLKNRITEKLESPTFNFLSHQLSEVKQIGEALEAIHHRIQTNLQKEEQIRVNLESKFKSIIDTCSSFALYFELVSQIYCYFNFQIERLLDVIMKSLVYTEFDEEKHSKSMKFIPELLSNETNKKIKRKICKWVCMSLQPADALHCYFLFACFSLNQNGELSNQSLQNIIQILTKKCTSLEEKLEIKLNLVVEAIKNQAENKMNLMIEYSDLVLGINFKSILPWDENWIQQIYTLEKESLDFNHDELCRKVFVTLADPTSYAFKTIDKELRRYLQPEQAIFYLSNFESIEHRIEMFEKTPINMQGWIVLANEFRIKNINKLIEFVEQSKNYRLLLVFENSTRFMMVKNKLVNPAYYQLSLYDKTKNVCFQIQRIIAKNEIDKSPELNKLLKIIAFDQIFSMCKGFSDPIYRSTSYSYRILENILRRNPKVTATDLTGYCLDFIYNLDNPAHRFFLREAKKQSKLPNIPEIFDDGSIPESYSNITLFYEQLKPKLTKEDRLKEFLDSILPLEESALLTTDFLFSFEKNYKRKEKMNQNIKTETFNRSEMLFKIESILQKTPVLSKEEENEKVAHLHIEILKLEKKCCQKWYSSTMNLLKTYKKMLESKKELSFENEDRILELLKDDEGLVNRLLSEDRKMQIIQKQIESKEQINLQTCLELVSKPQRFLYVYIFDEHIPVKMDWNNFELQMRVMPEKEKEKENFDKNENTQFAHAKVFNAKIETHKCFIESVGKGESSRIQNIIVYLGKEDQHLYSRKIPFILNGQKLLDVSITSKAKEYGFWECKIWISLAEKEERKSL